MQLNSLGTAQEKLRRTPEEVLTAKMATLVNNKTFINLNHNHRKMLKMYKTDLKYPKPTLIQQEKDILKARTN